MLKFNLQNGQSYLAQVKLTETQLDTTNDALTTYFEGLGFTEVTVTGTGQDRTFTGKWTPNNSSLIEHQFLVESWKKL